MTPPYVKDLELMLLQKRLNDQIALGIAALVFSIGLSIYGFGLMRETEAKEFIKGMPSEFSYKVAVDKTQDCDFDCDQRQCVNRCEQCYGLMKLVDERVKPKENRR